MAESVNVDVTVRETKDFYKAMFGPEFDKWLPSGFSKIMNLIKRKVWKKYLKIKLPKSPCEINGLSRRKMSKITLSGIRVDLSLRVSPKSQEWILRRVFRQ